MKKLYILLILGILVLNADEYFGRNKVQYRDQTWLIMESANFELHYPEGSEDVAHFAVEVLEEAYLEYTKIFGHQIREKGPVIIYPNKIDFQQTNVLMQIIPEGTGGFTELLHRRMVMPFDGSYKDFRHVLRHELVHLFQFDILYDISLSGFLSPTRYFEFPLWVAEGQAEYISSGWTEEADMYMSEVIFFDYTYEPEYLGGYLVYKQGQSMMRYMSRKYGIKKMGELLRNIRTYPGTSRFLEETIGKDSREFYREWLAYEKRRLARDFPERDMPVETGKNLTDHEENRSYINMRPALSPSGTMMAFVSDRRDYTDLFLMDLITGDVKRIDSGERGASLESLHPLRARSRWSKDGRYISYAGLKDGRDALIIYDTQQMERAEVLAWDDLVQIDVGSFSDDGTKLAISALSGGKKDIYVYNLLDSTLTKLTDDFYEDRDPVFYGDKVLFSSDRISENEGRYPPLRESYHFNLYTVDSAGTLESITEGMKEAVYPEVTSDMSIYFASIENGIRNIWVIDSMGSEPRPVTNLLSGIMDFSISETGDKIAFSCFTNGGYDIFEINFPEQVYVEPSFFLQYPDSMPSPTQLFDLEFPDTNGMGFEASDTTVVDREYRPRFITDMANVNVAYNTYYGLEGMSYIALSDLLGNHRLLLMGDLVIDLDKSNLYVGYGYFKHRFDWVGSAYYMNSWYRLPDLTLFRDNKIGVEGGVQYPFSQYSRLELMNRLFLLRREYYQDSLSRPDLSIWNLDSRLSFVEDNALWRSTGPITGTRKKLTVEYSPELSDSSPSYIAFEGDVRYYIHVGSGFGFAGRLAIGAARGSNPKRYMMGGTDNWFYPTIAENDIYSPKDMYYSKMVVPLRGYDYFNFSGNTYALMNLEFRYPFIRYLQLGFPPLMIQGLNGGIFLDMGTVWDDSPAGLKLMENGRAKDLKAGMGFGVRSGVAFFLVNYELGWRTDFTSTSAKPVHYFSIGAEF